MVKGSPLAFRMLVKYSLPAPCVIARLLVLLCVVEGKGVEDVPF